MLLEKYTVEINTDQTVYQFVSEGAKGDIIKVVRYSTTNLKDFYNLGFGDLNKETGIIDDKIVTDNGDGEKVLATVAATLYAFTFQYPDAWVFVQGSNAARTRMYRIGITKYLAEIEQDFTILGLLEKQWQPFHKNQNYEAFVAKRK